MAPPFKQAEFDILYNEGISREGEIIQLGVELTLIDKSVHGKLWRTSHWSR